MCECVNMYTVKYFINKTSTVKVLGILKKMKNRILRKRRKIPPNLKFFLYKILFILCLKLTKL